MRANDRIPSSRSAPIESIERLIVDTSDTQGHDLGRKPTYHRLIAAGGDPVLGPIGRLAHARPGRWAHASSEMTGDKVEEWC